MFIYCLFLHRNWIIRFMDTWLRVEEGRRARYINTPRPTKKYFHRANRTNPKRLGIIHKASLILITPAQLSSKLISSIITPTLLHSIEKCPRSMSSISLIGISRRIFQGINSSMLRNFTKPLSVNHHRPSLPHHLDGYSQYCRFKPTKIILHITYSLSSLSTT